jgi:hypothetical protein
MLRKSVHLTHHCIFLGIPEKMKDFTNGGSNMHHIVLQVYVFGSNVRLFC